MSALTPRVGVKQTSRVRLLRKACEFGLEGLVSKRRDRPYRGGRSKDWVKLKNRSHPAMERVKGINDIRNVIV